MNIEIDIKTNKLVLSLDRIKAEAEGALFDSTREAAQSVSRHIKNDLLDGVMLYDTSGFPRATNTTSLEQGELRKSVFVTPRQNAAQAIVTVGLRGSAKLKEIANYLIEGRSGPWQIPATLPNPTGRHLLMITRIGERPDKPEFDEKFSTSFDHPGYGPHPFMTQGLEDRKSYFIQLAQHMIRKAVRNG